MYNNGNSSKNVTGASIVDGTVETVDIADDAVTADKLANSVNTDIGTGVTASTTAGDALPKAGGTMTGTIAGFESTGIDDNATSTAITIGSDEGLTFSTEGVTYGSFKPRAGVVANIILDPRVNGAGLTGATDVVLPIDETGTRVDNQISLGAVDYHFKDLHLGGSVYLGGTAAANALDDYEEGTWTPTLRFSGNSVGVAGTLEGTYVKIGRAVTLSCSITLTSKGSSTGGVTIGGLPFTSESSNGNQAPAAIGRIINISFADMMHAHNNAASDIIYLQETSNAGTLSNIDNTNFTDTSSLKLNVTYQT